MKRLKNGIPVLYELHHEVEYVDDFGEYTMDLYIRLIWSKGLHWMISTGDLSVCDTSLTKCAMFAIRILLKGNQTPCYYRLKEHLDEERCKKNESNGQ